MLGGKFATAVSFACLVYIRYPLLLRKYDSVSVFEKTLYFCPFLSTLRVLCVVDFFYIRVLLPINIIHMFEFKKNLLVVVLLRL